MILMHPRRLVCTAHSWHAGLQLMESILLLSSQRQIAATTGATVLRASGNGRQQRQAQPLKWPTRTLLWTCMENVSSTTARSLSLDTYLARDKAWEHAGVCKHIHFYVPEVLPVSVSQQGRSLHCTNWAKHLPGIISRLGNGNVVGWPFPSNGM